QTQRAFRAGMAQTDQMEGGRMFTEMLSRDLQQITPTYQTNGLNFFAEVPTQNPSYYPLEEVLPASTVPRTNILHDLFFMSRYNQTWSGVGYFVRTNAGIGTYADNLGSLYRYETNIHVSQLDGLYALQPYFNFLQATNFPNGTNNNVSKVLDGVVEFRVRVFDRTNG